MENKVASKLFLTSVHVVHSFVVVMCEFVVQKLAHNGSFACI